MSGPRALSITVRDIPAGATRINVWYFPDEPDSTHASADLGDGRWGRPDLGVLVETQGWDLP
jgi:hypothetical protein